MSVSRSIAALLVCLACMAATALAEEIWVPPTHVETPQLNVIWPETRFGLGRFAVALPDRMATFVAARVVVLPELTVNAAYSVFADARKNGETVSLADVELGENRPIALVEDQVTEIDVSDVVGAALADASPGEDYLAVLFFFPTGALDSGRVLGMRFVYESVPIEASGLADGAVSSAVILDEAVGSDDIAEGAVTSSEIQDAGILLSDLAPSAVGAAATVAVNGNTSLGTVVSLDSFTVEAPGAGQLTLLLVLDTSLNCDSSGPGSRICSNAAVGICDEAASLVTCGKSFRQVWYEDPDDTDVVNARRLVTISRTVPVSPGPHTYYLNGRSHELGMSFVVDGYAIALFTPGTMVMTNP